MTSAQALLSLAVDAVCRSSEIVRTSRPGAVTSKGDRDMASDVDLQVERETREFLRRSAPEIGFLGEENGHDGDRDRYWVLDPVDGTANFVRDIPLCAVSLALVDNGVPIIGVIRLPFLGQLYTAERGGGAYEDDRRLHVSTTAELRDSIVALGDYAVGEDAVEKNRARLVLTQRLADRAQRVRMLGTAAVDLAWVAAGRLDASMTLSNKPWDMAAGALLVQESGGRVVDRDGTDYSIDAAVTVATTPALTGELLELLAEAESPR